MTTPSATLTAPMSARELLTSHDIDLTNGLPPWEEIRAIKLFQDSTGPLREELKNLVYAYIYKRYYKRTRSICYEMTRNIDRAEDLTQDAFLCLYKNLGKFQGDSKFMTWFHRIVVNLVLMDFRKKSNRVEHVTSTGDMGRIRGINFDGTHRRPPMIILHDDDFVPRAKVHLSTTHDVNGNRVLALDIQKALSELPAGYRTVFTLHDIEGYEHHEIAEKLGVTQGTSKSQLHKARLKLRTMLSKEALPLVGMTDPLDTN